MIDAKTLRQASREPLSLAENQALKERVLAWLSAPMREFWHLEDERLRRRLRAAFGRRGGR